MRLDNVRVRRSAGDAAVVYARAMFSLLLFCKFVWTFAGDSALRDCTFTTPAGDFDLAPLGAVRIVSSEAASFGWTYLFSACANVNASTAAGHCSGASPAVQATSGACFSLGSLKQRSVAPLSADRNGRRVGVTVALEGGDSCGGGVTRTISIDVVCADVVRACKVRVLESTTRACVYDAAVESRAGCPLACARDPATGAVCGGKLRGACVVTASGTAACVCLSGHAGPLCAAETAEPARLSSFASSVAVLIVVVAGMAVAGMLAAFAANCCCQTNAACASGVDAVPFLCMPRMLLTCKTCVLIKGGLKPLGAFAAAALMFLTLLDLVAPGGNAETPPLQLKQVKQTTVASAVPVTGAGLLVFCVTGSYANFFLYTLGSLERFAPDAFVVVMADTHVEDELKRSLTTAPTNVRVRIYRFQALMKAANTSSNGILVDRYAVLPLILNDFADGRKQEPSASGFVAWESDSFSQTTSSLNVAYAGMFDTRDLVFQGDPFQPLREAVLGLSPPIQGALTLALESKHIPIGSCSYNRKWVTESFGSDAARAVATFRICNGGCLLGSIHSLRDFVVSVLNPAILWSVATARDSQSKPYLDQGALTFVGPAMIAAASVRSTKGGAGRLAAFTALSGPQDIVLSALKFAERNIILEASAEGSWICTIGYFPAINIQPVLDNEGYLVSLWEPEERCRIVHQFDRYPRLSEHFMRIFERK
jgi:hypothetical protein